MATDKSLRGESLHKYFPVTILLRFANQQEIAAADNTPGIRVLDVPMVAYGGVVGKAHFGNKR